MILSNRPYQASIIAQAAVQALVSVRWVRLIMRWRPDAGVGG